MKYQGGKHIAGQHIARVISKEAPQARIFADVTVGGAGVLVHMVRQKNRWARIIANDAHLDLILLWVAASSGQWKPPAYVPRDVWNDFRDSDEPSPARGFVGYGCSFSGGWFNSYAMDEKPTDKHPGGLANAERSGRSLAKKAVDFGEVLWRCGDYETVNPTKGWAVYADPPYAGTGGLRQARDFDHERFWATMQRWTEEGVKVFVSEYAAPEGWEFIWERETPLTVSGAPGQNSRKQLERLWVWAG